MIPVAKPFFDEHENIAVKEVLLSGWVTQGPKVKEFENKFAKYIGSEFACAVSNCTTALHLSLLAVGVKPGDIVITVSHSFIATANCIRHCFAEPYFIDINPETYNISTDKLEFFLKNECISKGNGLFYKNVKKLIIEESPLKFIDVKKIGRVSAILPVHQMGIPCDIDKIISIAKKYNLPVIEDAACAIGSEIYLNNKWEKIGKPHGDIACFSFHPRKVLTTGDGGMITTNNKKYDEKFRLLRQHGMSISDLKRNNSQNIVFEEYITTGYNYRMTDLQASVGIEQLNKIDFILKKRRNIDALYRKYLSGIDWVELPKKINYINPNWQSYPIKILENSPKSRDEIMQFLLDNGVSSRAGIMNAHEEIVYKNKIFDLPLSEKARRGVILLPIYHDISENDIQYIFNIFNKL